MSEHKEQALAVRQALWNFQKELLNTLKQQHDVEMGYESNPTEWFHVLTGTERFLWLRELTSLMADVDVLTELDLIEELQVQIIRAEIERLLFSEDTTHNFVRNVRPLLMNGPALLPLYTLLKAHLKKINAIAVSLDEAQAARKQWQQDHIEQSRKRRM